MPGTARSFKTSGMQMIFNSLSSFTAHCDIKEFLILHIAQAFSVIYENTYIWQTGFPGQLRGNSLLIFLNKSQIMRFNVERTCNILCDNNEYTPMNILCTNSNLLYTGEPR